MGTVQGSKVRLEQLRPRAKSKLSFLKLDLKHEVLVNNHNIEKPEERGFWYYAMVTAWRSTWLEATKMMRTTATLSSTLKLDSDCLLLNLA